jgi:hypothetical protein
MHGDSGLEAPERFAGHEVDAPLMPCSQLVRKWRQRQLAKLRSATDVAAEADLQPVTALSKLAAVSIACFRSVRFSLQCSGAFIGLAHVCRRPTLCRSMSLPSYSAFAHVQVAVHEGGVGGANPDARIPSGPSDSVLPTQHRRQGPYAHSCAKSIPAILYSLQLATYNMRLSTCSLQACAKQRARSATFNRQQTWLQPCNI